MALDRGYAAPPDSPGPPPPHVPGGSDVTAHAVAERWALPGLPESARRQLADPRSLAESDVLRANDRELHRHGQGAGRPRRTAARQRPARARRLLRAARDDGGGARRVLFARRAARSPTPAAARLVVLSEGRQPGARLRLRHARGCRPVRGVGRARSTPSRELRAGPRGTASWSTRSRASKAITSTSSSSS